MPAHANTRRGCAPTNSVACNRELVGGSNTLRPPCCASTIPWCCWLQPTVYQRLVGWLVGCSFFLDHLPLPCRTRYTTPSTNEGGGGSRSSWSSRSSRSSSDNENVSSWGGSILFDAASNQFHGWASEMTHHCGINAWETNSQARGVWCGPVFVFVVSRGIASGVHVSHTAAHSSCCVRSAHRWVVHFSTAAWNRCECRLREEPRHALCSVCLVRASGMACSCGALSFPEKEDFSSHCSAAPRAPG
jgi:hypothetical protein